MNTTSRRMNTTSRRRNRVVEDVGRSRASPYSRNENVVEYNLGSYTKNEDSNVASLNVVRATNIPNVVCFETAMFNQFISLLLTNMRKEIVTENVEEAPDVILVEDSIIILNEEDKMVAPNTF